MPWHHNDLAALTGISFFLSLHLTLSFLITCYNGTYGICYSFTIEGYDMTVTIEFFPHIIVLEDSSLESMDDEFEDVDTFLNL